MIEPKRVLRALAEHWALLEPLCEHFDQGTLSLNELRTQLAAQQLDSTPQDITSLLDVWIRLDILIPVAKSPNRFELNAQIHDFLAYLRREHRLGLCLEIEAYLRHLERLAGYIQDAFEVRDGHDLARQLRLLDMRVRDVLKKLDNDEQALVAVAERAKTSDRQIPLRQRYAEVLATWDEYVEPMIDLVNADGAFEQGVRKVETVLLKMLSEQQRLGHLVDDDMLLRTHARILEMQTSAQLTLRHARELLLPLREEARRHNAVTRGAALALAAIRRKGIDAVPQAAMPLFTRPQSTFLGSASQVEAYVYALARFEPKPARFPKAHKTQKGEAPRAPRTVREMVDRCEEALPMPDLMTWLLEQEPDGATDELLYWFSRLSREKRFKRERLERREYHTHEHQVSLRSFALLSASDAPPRILRASPMHLDLSELSQLAPIFRELFKGYHVSRRDPELYAQLSNFQDQYRTLFKALGFELVCDTRGFYYFVPDMAAAAVNKTAQRLALFTFILVEHLADQGRDPIAVLDGGSLGREELPSLLEKYRDLFIQAEVQTVEELEEKIMRRMTQLGFASEENGVYRFLPPMHRFLDVCLSVQQDRDLAASVHSVLPLPAPVLIDEAAEAKFLETDDPLDLTEFDEESEEDALARAIAEEQESDA
jgi:hypothetical protein